MEKFGTTQTEKDSAVARDGLAEARAAAERDEEERRKRNANMSAIRGFKFG